MVTFLGILFTGCSEESRAIWQISHSRNPQKRIAAVKRLAEIGNQEAIAGIIEALDDNVKVSNVAIEVLAGLGEKAFDELIKALAHKSGRVRRNAIKTLGLIYDAEFRKRYESGDFKTLSWKKAYRDEVVFCSRASDLCL
jgi:hypothetical protein